MTEKSPQIAQNVAHYLIKRLDQKNVNTQRKTLQVIAYLAEHGPYPFIEEMVRNESELRRMADFRGQKDPLYGDELNQQIRNAAQKAIQSLYSATEKKQQASRAFEAPIGNSNGVSNNFGGWENAMNNQNFGPNFNSTPNLPNFPNSNFGNPNFGNPNFGNQNFGNQNFGNQNFGNQNFPNSQSGISSSQFQGLGNSPYSPSSSNNQDTESKGGFFKKILSLNKNNNNKNFQLNPEEYPNFLSVESKPYVPPIVSGSIETNVFKNVSSIDSSPKWDNNDGESSVKDRKFEDIDEESKLVEELCGQNGVRVQPSRPELRTFTNKSRNLNIEKIISELEERLSGNHKWGTKLKALCAIEALIQDDFSDVSEYFSKNITSIQKQSDAVQSSVRDKAKSILKLISPQDSNVSHISNSNTQNSNEEFDIFSEDFNNPLNSQNNYNTNDTEDIKTNEKVNSLFKNLSLKSNQVSTKVTSTTTTLDDIFSETTITNQPISNQTTNQNSKQALLESLDILMAPNPVSVNPVSINPVPINTVPVNPVSSNPLTFQTNNVYMRPAQQLDSQNRFQPNQNLTLGFPQDKITSTPFIKKEEILPIKKSNDNAFKFVDDLLKKGDSNATSTSKSAFSFI